MEVIEMRKVLGIMVITSLLISCQITVNMVDPTNLVAVPTIADLEQLNILEDGQEVYVEGYWMTDDGGGGVFVYCQESTASLDGGTVFAAGNNQGRWHRVVSDNQPVNGKWFGLQSDQKECQSGRLYQAMKYAILTESKTLYIPQGSYYIANQLRFPAGLNITGDGFGKTILWSDNPGGYLVGNPTGGKNYQNATISKLTLSNSTRLLLMENVSNIQFYQTEFIGGIVRFENSSYITIDQCQFRNNLGKAAYASDQCSYITLTNNIIINPEEGGINLSRHQNSYVAHNEIISNVNIQSGYAGIRLPNDAYNNVVENNIITRMGRGIFVLSNSTNNVIRNNIVSETTYQGIFVQSSNNLIENNQIINAGDESIYVVDDGSSKANNNIIRDNNIYDTKYHPGGSRFIGLRVYGSGNQVLNNRVSREYGRVFKDISSGNLDQGNQYL